jgi:ribonuclease P protein component
VKRNRIRRVLREAIKARWPKVKPYDILISVKPGVLKIAETQAVSELIKFLEQIKIIQ